MLNLNRRTLLATGAALSLTRADTTRADPSQHYDVIIVGGGTAGIPCALFAAQGGARVLLIEKSPALGGTFTNCMLVTPAITFGRLLGSALARRS